MRLLLLSNSRNAGEARFAWAAEEIQSFFGSALRRFAFVPYAAVGFPYDEYEAMVQAPFAAWGYEVTSIHHAPDPTEAIRAADAILVGGGNTFHLVHELHRTGVMQAIQQAVLSGTPYLGWSAGANVACPSMRTTNDMPIIQPASFETLGFVPFQINPHFTTHVAPNHAGETREDRIREFLALNQGLKVVGLPEGCLLHLEGMKIRLVGREAISIFAYNQPRQLDASGEDLQSLMVRV